MPTLDQIVDRFTNLMPHDEKQKSIVSGLIRGACLDYARSIVPEEKVAVHDQDFYEFDNCRTQLLERIDKDSKSV